MRSRRCGCTATIWRATAHVGNLTNTRSSFDALAAGADRFEGKGKLYVGRRIRLTCRYLENSVVGKNVVRVKLSCRIAMMHY